MFDRKAIQITRIDDGGGWKDGIRDQARRVGGS